MTGRAAELRAQGHDVISLSAGEPDFEPPPHVEAAAIGAVRQGRVRYTAVAGLPELRRAIAAKLARENHLHYRTDQILVSSGAKQSCYNACLALLDPGDEAIIAAPYWVSYPDMVRLAGALPVIVPTSPQRKFLLAPEQLRAAINARTRLLVLNSPCNPTGAVYSASDLAALGEVLAAHPQVTVLADDIYEHIYWHAEPFATFAEACPRLFDRTITINGVSKSYAMTGWRIGYAAGPKNVIEAMTTLQSQSTTSACTISQHAAIAALDGPQDFVRAMCAEFRRRHEWIVQRINAIPGFEMTPASGAFYAFPSVEAVISASGYTDDEHFCNALLEEAGIAVVPGSAFGAPGYVRLSFACSEAILDTALARLDRFVRSIL